jgi:nuclear pore complex protein Nup37
MSVCWHTTEPGKLLVAEKSGLLQLFNTLTQQPIISLDSGTTPLMSAHFGRRPTVFSFLHWFEGKRFVWDISRPR